MIRLGKVFNITKISAIQTAGLSALFFAFFISSYSSNAAGKDEMGQWDNTSIRNYYEFETEIGIESYEVP